MTSNYFDTLWRTRRFSDFLYGSGTRYRVHSPFLYEMIENVVRNRAVPPELNAVEDLRRRYLQSKKVIQKTDFGKGAGNDGRATYPVAEKKIASRSLMRRRHALRLHHLAKYMKAGTILELGTSFGLTTAYLALSSMDARVISIEGCPELCKKARGNLEMLGIKNAGVIEGRFQEKLGEVLEQLGKVDFLLIDGDHRKDSLLANLERCNPYLHNDSVVILDDIHYDPGMEEAWEIVSRREEVRISLDFFYTGWLFFRKESSKEHFRLRYL